MKSSKIRANERLRVCHDAFNIYVKRVISNAGPHFLILHYVQKASRFVWTLENPALFDIRSGRSSHEKSTFYKIKEGCPNFHRTIGDKENLKYSIKSNRHDYYFFPWNRNKEKLDLFDYFYPKWRLITILLNNFKSRIYS